MRDVERKLDRILKSLDEFYSLGCFAGPVEALQNYECASFHVTMRDTFTLNKLVS